LAAAGFGKLKPSTTRRKSEMGHPEFALPIQS